MSNMASTNIKVNPLGIAVVVGSVVVVFLYLFSVHSSRSHEVEMKELLSASIHAARLGGEKVKEIRDLDINLHEKSKGKTKEGADELKTDGDMASHMLMYHGLKTTFPFITVVSEEHEKASVTNVQMLNIDLPDVSKIVGDKVNANDVTVWIDPLDATQEYSENLREYVTTMVCVAVKGKPVIGVIHRAFSQETVWAYVGHGQSDNLHLVNDVKHNEGEGYKIIVSRSHSGSVKEVAKKGFGEETEVIPAGGAGFKTLEVIEGRADAYVHVTAIKKWDICAGNAILLAVNGKQTTLTNKEIDYSSYGSPLNSEGLLVSTSNHDKYLSVLAPIFQENHRSKRETEHKIESNYRIADRL